MILLLTVATYVPALRAGYIWDDDAYLTRNATLKDTAGLQRIWGEVGATPQYYPLVFTSFWIEQRIWGLQPAGYHAVNVLLHAAAAILLWRVLRRLGLPGAWLAATIFALHPMEVESVAWITERKNVLSGALGLGSLLAYLRFAGIDCPEHTAQRSWPAYGLSIVLFIGALLSKTVVCSLPAVLLLILWWKRDRLRRADLLSLVPMLILGLTLGLTTVWIEKHVVGARGEPWALSLVERFLLAGRVLWFYAGKLLWPTNLMFSYPRWQLDAHAAWQYLYPLAVIGIVEALWMARRRLGRGPLAGVLIYAGVLFPALGFISVYPMQFSFVADHFAYHAGIALIAMGTAALARLANLVWKPASPGRLDARSALLSGLLLASLATATWRQARIYRDADTLWQHTLSQNPQSWVAHLNLAQIHHLRRDREGFITHMEEAVRLRPTNANGHKVLGDALSAMGRYDAAAAHYTTALAYVPDDGQMHHNLANILAGKGALDEAVKHYRACIQQIPNDAVPHYSLGLTLQAQRQPREAMDEFRAALAIRPEWHVAKRELAWMLATQADPQLRNASQAVELAKDASDRAGGNDPLYLDALAAAQACGGEFTTAAQTARQAISLMRPDSDPALLAGLRQRLANYERNQPYIAP